MVEYVGEDSEIVPFDVRSNKEILENFLGKALKIYFYDSMRKSDN